MTTSGKRLGLLLALACAWLAPNSRAQLVVTTTADIPVASADCTTPGSTSCTLRAALARLLQPGVSERRIVFDLPGPAPHVIRVDPALGSLVSGIFGSSRLIEIDGLSQLGAGRRVGSDPDNPVDYVLAVGIASPQFQTVDGPLLIMRGNTLVRGIAFFDHDGVGVRLETGIIETSFFNTLDGTNPGPRHLTKGVDFVAVGTTIIPTSVRSSLFMGPGVGIEIRDERPTGAPLGSAAGATFSGNYFGTDRTGLLSRPVEYGVLSQIITPPPEYLFKPSPVQPSIEGGLFYAADVNAIRLRGVFPRIVDVSIGYDASGALVTGASPITQGAGILLEGPTFDPDRSFSLSGGVSTVRIYGQRGPGIQLDDTLGPIENLQIHPISLFGNGGLGISLTPGSPGMPTPNDVGDADAGPNGRQNYPVLTSATRILDQNEERIAIGLTLESKPDHEYWLQFFANSQCDPSGHGEGEVQLEESAYVATDASGRFSGIVTLATDMSTALARLQGRPFVTALVSVTGGSVEEDHNTSEFSPCLDASNLTVPGQQLGLDATEYTAVEGQPAGVSVQRTGGTTGEVRVRLRTSDGTAVSGRDYTAVDQELVFADGIASVGVLIPSRPENTVSEPTREFAVSLLSPTGGAAINPLRATATVRIFDDDATLVVTDSVGAPDDGLIDFGAVEFGSVHDASVTLRNPGSATVLFSAKPGLDPGVPGLTEIANTCAVTLAPNDECLITVRFTAGGMRITTAAVVDIPATNVAPTSVSVRGRAPPEADLALLIGVAPPNPMPGAAVAFSAAALNRGPASAASSEVRIALPAEIAPDLGTFAPTQGTVSYDPASRTIFWSTGALSVASTTPATLNFSAMANAVAGDEITTRGTVTLTDANRVDPDSSDDFFDATIAVGVRAADLYIDPASVRILRSGGAAASIIPIMRRCRTSRDECEDSSSDRNEWRTLEVTVNNAGPDAADEPPILRITSGFCFGRYTIVLPGSDLLWMQDSDGFDIYEPVCQHGTVYERALDPLPGGAAVTARLGFRATSGPIGVETLQVEVVHGAFDPNESNNLANSPAIQVVIPFAGGGDERGLGADLVGDYCFIATAAYGSWLDPHVTTLRAFRDRWLLTNTPGRAFVAWYYRVSPRIADWIAGRAWARAIVRGLLAPVVFAIAYPLAAGALLTLAIALFIFRRRLRFRVQELASIAMTGRAPRQLALLAAVSALAVSAPAAGQPDANWFAGAALGISRVDGYELGELASDVDEQDVGWRIFGGRRIGRYFAAGISYVDFGSVTSTGSPVINLDFTDRVDVDGVELTAMGLWPVAERFEFYGAASYLFWSQDVEFIADGQVSRADASGGSGGLGGGLNIRLSRRLMITFDARRYVGVGDRAESGREHRRDLLTVGISYPFGSRAVPGPR